MNKLRFSVALLFTVCMVVSPVFPVGISKDTVYVNDIDFSTCSIFRARVGVDTLKLWNTVDTQVTLDSFEIIFNPLHDLFRVISCEATNSFSELNNFDIALLGYKDTLVWIKNGRIDCLIKNNPPYNKITIPEALISPDFNSYLNFNRADTCAIYAICLTPCFNCHSYIQGYFIDFSVQLTLSYNDGSQVSFHCINEYTTKTNTRPAYHLPSKINIPDNGMFNIKGQLFHRSFGKYSPGIYLRTKEKVHHEPRVLLHPNSEFNGETAAVP